MANRRIGGILYFKVDGEQYNAKGEWTTNAGVPEKKMVVGSDGVHGYTETPQVPKIEGAITITAGEDIEKIQNLSGVTLTLELANGQVFVLEDAVYSASGDYKTGESELEAMFEGIRGRYIL